MRDGDEFESTGADSVKMAVTEQWHQIYRPALEEMGVRSAYDWYSHETIVNKKDNWPLVNDQRAHADLKRTLRNICIGVLYRVSHYTNQPYTIVGRMPEPKIREMVPGQNITGFENEIPRLQDIDGVRGMSQGDEPVPTKEISHITTPNWASWLGGHAVNSDGSWSGQFGTLWSELYSISDKLSISGDYEQYFDVGTKEPHIFKDFYYTNRFKLPWPKGQNPPNEFSKNSIDSHFEQELSAASPDLIISMGNPAFKMINRLFNTEAASGITDEHGRVFTIEICGDIAYWVPVIHPGYPFKWKGGEDDTTTSRLEVLQDSLNYLRRKGVI